MILFYSMIYKNTKLIRNIIKRICKNKALAFTWNVKADTKVYSCCKIFQLVIIIKNYTTSIIFNISFYSLQITDFHSFEELKDEIKNDLDIFDLICHIAWDAPALTRKERAENVRKRNYWTKYGDKARNVLNAILDKYAETGIEAIEDMKVLTVPPITDIGTPKEIIDSFGGKPQYLQAIRELEAEIYKVA